MAGSGGTVYLVGAGPGDPGLLTVRGAALLRRAGAVVFDHLANKSLLDLASPTAELRDVGKSGDGAHQMSQGQINDLLVELAARHSIVVRLKGGDPYVLGRGGEEMIHMRRAGVACVVVPGVTSAIAAPACAGIPVTHRRAAAMVTIVTGHEDPTKDGSDVDWAAVARTGGTVVSLMGMGRLEAIVSALIAGGRAPSTPAAIVSWGTTPLQRVASGTLEDIVARAAAARLGAPGILVVGEVVRVRDEILPESAMPLGGKTVLTTRSREQASRLTEALCELGATVVEVPAFRVVPPRDEAALEAAAAGLGRYDWVVFTSANGVAALFGALGKAGRDARAFGGARIAVIGPGTAEALADRGIRADLVPDRFIAEGILEAFDGVETSGRRFLLCRAEEAREVLARGLRERGAEVDEVCAYRLERETLAPVAAERIDRGEIDAVTFTSGSTVRGLYDLLGERRFRALGDRALVASIGPVTSAEAARLGLTVAAEAGEHSIPGLVGALVERLGRDGGGVRS